jgi:hypothetical protein
MWGGYQGLFSGLQDRYGSAQKVIPTDPAPVRHMLESQDVESGMLSRIPNVYQGRLESKNAVEKRYWRGEKQRKDLNRKGI